MFDTLKHQMFDMSEYRKLICQNIDSSICRNIKVLDISKSNGWFIEMSERQVFDVSLSIAPCAEKGQPLFEDHASINL